MLRCCSYVRDTSQPRPSYAFLMLSYSKTFFLTKPYVHREPRKVLLFYQCRSQRCQNVAGIRACLPGGVPSLAVAVRRPAPPLHEFAGVDGEHGLPRRVRRLVQNMNVSKRPERLELRLRVDTCFYVAINHV